MLNAVYNTFCTIQNGICALIVDRVGRVRLLLTGVIGCAICLSLEAAMVARFSGTDNRVGNGFGVFFLFCFIGVYALCINATTYIYCGELFPTHIRNQGMAFSLMGQFLTTITFVEAAPTGFANIGWKFYLIFIALCCISSVVLYFFFPETKQMTLEEIGTFFKDEVAHVDGTTGGTPSIAENSSMGRKNPSDHIEMP
jgi:MFS family permease